MEHVVAWLDRNNLNFEMVLQTVILLFVTSAVTLLLKRRLLRSLFWRAESQLHLPYETLLIFARVVTGGLWFISGMLVLSLWGVNVNGLWTLLVSIAAVIGVGFLAVWTIASNITASFFITIWRPFHFGQTVEILPENLKGRIIDRNLMFTVLREEGGRVLQIPNNFFFQKMFRVTDAGAQSFFEFLEEEGMADASEPSPRR
jgi:small-conductance mechanosensitive channel